MSQIIIVARHGVRADTLGIRWEDDTTRPWDPPLALEGWQDAWTRFVNLPSAIPKPEIIFSSPYLRCLQTASVILKTFKLPYSKLTVEKGLSESYDYFNSVRYVDSPDIIADGKYRPMAEWFYTIRCRMINTAGRPFWALKKGTTLGKQMKSYVYDFWRDKSRPRIKEVGIFPSFEMPIAYSFLKKGRNARYIEAFERCIRYNVGLGDCRKTSLRPPKVLAIVTHRAGVETLYEYLLGKSCPNVPPAGHFVISRTIPNGSDRPQCDLLFTKLDASNKFKNL